jgi:poly-gamma-glutamate synthesis protein (capsule biosynthesis protein)
MRYASAVVLIVGGMAAVAIALTGGDPGDPDVRAVSPAPAVAAPSTTSTTTVAPRTFTLAATGDVLLHAPVNQEAARYGAYWGADYDYVPMFARVAPILSAADLALCHLETPIAPPGAAIRSGGIFASPPEIVTALASAGYDGCSTASNHSIDAGRDGVRATLDELDAYGIGHAGTARTPDEAATLRVHEVRGVRVAHLAYTYGLNGLRVPDGEEHLVAVVDPARILADAAQARAAADVVVVSLHWGVEYARDPTDAQRSLAEQLAGSPDVDLVVGHHAHVVQPVARVGDLVVAYGLGNFLSNQSGECCPVASQDGVVLQFRFTETAPASGTFTIDDVSYTATIVDRESFTILPIAPALGDPALAPDVRERLEASQRRTDEALALLGPLAHPG